MLDEWQRKTVWLKKYSSVFLDASDSPINHFWRPPKKRLNAFSCVSFFEVHGTEGSSYCHQNQKNTPKSRQTTTSLKIAPGKVYSVYENLVKWACLGYEMFNNMENNMKERANDRKNIVSTFAVSWRITKQIQRVPSLRAEQPLAPSGREASLRGVTFTRFSFVFKMVHWRRKIFWGKNTGNESLHTIVLMFFFYPIFLF